LARSRAQRVNVKRWPVSLERRLAPKSVLDRVPKRNDRLGLGAGLRLDHLLLNPRSATRLLSAEVDLRPRAWPKTGDHAPVVIEVADA
jgi:endonuclease/exonuclease/phosphatase family metal-dependent hydrolase